MTPPVLGSHVGSDTLILGDFWFASGLLMLILLSIKRLVRFLSQPIARVLPATA
jgi:hypothetical protein